MTITGKNRIMIFGPETDGTYVVEFRTVAGEALDGRPSNKLTRAGSYGIPVVSGRRFLEWVGKAVPDSLHRTYSADQIASLSKLSNSTIDELVQFGLLDPRGGLFGFRDLARARQISNLFAHGISLSEILRCVKGVRAWLPEADFA